MLLAFEVPAAVEHTVVAAVVMPQHNLTVAVHVVAAMSVEPQHIQTAVEQFVAVGAGGDWKHQQEQHSDRPVVD